MLEDSLGEKAALRKSGAMGEAKKEEAPEAVDPKVRLARVACGAVLLAVAGTEFVSVVLTDRKSTRLNSSHANISYAVFCLKKKMPEPRELESTGPATEWCAALDTSWHPRCLR